MAKLWWLGFPRFKCPHCDQVINGIKFEGRFKLPRPKKHKTEQGAPDTPQVESQHDPTPPDA